MEDLCSQKNPGNFRPVGNVGNVYETDKCIA